MTRPVIVIGAGGHAAVVADALLAGGAVVLGFTDPQPARRGSMLCGLPVLGDDVELGANAQLLEDERNFIDLAASPIFLVDDHEVLREFIKGRQRPGPDTKEAPQ